MAKHTRAAAARFEYKQASAARTWQKAWRGFAARDAIEKQSAAVNDLQRVWRGRENREGFAAAKKAAVRLQGASRGRLARIAMLQLRLLRALGPEGQKADDTEALDKAAAYASRVLPRVRFHDTRDAVTPFGCCDACCLAFLARC